VTLTFGKILKPFFTISAMTFRDIVAERYGQQADLDVAWQSLEPVARTLLDGFHMALEEGQIGGLVLRLNAVEKELRGIAYEGAGMGLMAVCDIVVAAQDCVFGFTEVKLGIIPAVISPYVLAKIGESWARALFLTGERFGAEVARQIGLAHWIADAEGLDAMVEQKVGEITSSGPQAVREAKQLIQGVLTRPPGERRDYTVERIATVRASDEGQAGLRAFLDKRPASWREHEIER